MIFHSNVSTTSCEATCVPQTHSYVTASDNAGSKTLTLTGDVDANSVLITQRGNVLEVQGAGQTRMGTALSNTQLVTYPIAGDYKIVCNFNQSATPPSAPTNDSVSLVAVNSSNTSIAFGSGADAANLTYCNIGTLLIDGGTNPQFSPDSVSLVATKVTSKTIIDVP